MEGRYKIRRGDLIYADLGQHPRSSVQSGCRPCVVVSCDIDNSVETNTVITVCPCSTKYEEQRRREHVLLTPKDVEGFLSRPSLIMAEQLVPVDRRRIESKAGHIANRDVIDRLNKAMLFRLELDGTEEDGADDNDDSSIEKENIEA